ncbi:MAG: hypothetical protein MJK04_01375, partial [Psychrosphaera sp.]|nr:hypothetical protein [Psychrosphaera sp.]
PDLVSSLDNDCCGRGHRCKLVKGQCKIYETFGHNDLLWMGIDRTVVLATCEEIHSEPYIDDLDRLGQSYAINGVFPLKNDFELIKELNQHRNEIKIDPLPQQELPSDESATIGKTSVKDERVEVVLGFNQFRVRDGESLAFVSKELDNSAENISLLSLAKLNTHSLYWPSATKKGISTVEINVCLQGGGYREPETVKIEIFEDSEVNDQHKAPIYYDILVTRTAQQLLFVPFCYFLDNEGGRHEHTGKTTVHEFGSFVVN